MRRGSIVLAAALLLAALPAWGTQISAETRPDQLRPGTYSTTITADDVPPHFPPAFISLFIGVWEIEFTEAGSYVVTKESQAVVEGRYTSNPELIVATDVGGPFACAHPRVATGGYRWTLEDNALTLEVVRDACGSRAVVLTAHPLERQ